jgi:hypothetical protein
MTSDLLQGALTFLVGYGEKYDIGSHLLGWSHRPGMDYTIQDNYDWIMETREEMILNGGSWETEYPEHRGWELFSLPFIFESHANMSSIDEFIDYNYCRHGYFNYDHTPREEMGGYLAGALNYPFIYVDDRELEIKPLPLLVARYEMHQNNPMPTLVVEEVEMEPALLIA